MFSYWFLKALNVCTIGWVYIGQVQPLLPLPSFFFFRSFYLIFCPFYRDRMDQ